MGKVAYELREDFAGEVDTVIDGENVTVPLYSGGLIKIGFDEDLDVSVALEEGGGTIVVDEAKTAAVLALDEYPPLKRVPVPADADTVAGYLGQGRDALAAELERRGIKAGKATKADLAAALERLDANPVTTLDPDNPPTVDEVLAGDYDGAPEEA